MRTLALALALALALPLVAAQAAPHPIALLTYLADDGLPDGLAPIPATLVDGVLRASDAPEGNPASAFAHERELQRLLDERAATAAPVTLTIDATSIDASSRDDLANVTLHVVPFQDTRDGRRFVAGAEHAPTTTALSPSTPIHVDRPPTDLGGIVVFVSTTSAVGTFAAGEVVQAATWTPGQAGATIASAKTILVQHATATWCEPCEPSDQAILLLAGASDAPTAHRSYALAPTPLAIAGLLGGAAIAVLLLRRIR